MSKTSMTRASFVEVLTKLRLQSCAYSHKTQAAMCDCKFHAEGEVSHPFSENGNGCPELAWVIAHIEDMTDRQFERFSRWPLRRRKSKAASV